MSASHSLKPVKVLEVLEATVGGTRRHLVDIVAHLDPARIQVSAACSTRRDPAFLDDLARMTAKGIQVHIIPMRRAISPVGDLLALFRLFRLMRRGRFDVVHTHSSKAGFVGRLAARLAGVRRIIHTPHTFPFEMDVSLSARFAYRQLERLAACFTDCIVCVCPSQRALAESLIDPARVVVIENGIGDPPPANAAEQERQRRHLGIEAESLVIGVVGRFTRQKGHAHFIEAARDVATRYPGVRFLLVGDGELRQTLEQKIATAGLGDRFIVVGAREDVPELLPVFDLVVLPSLWEGLPYVLLEAMAAGKPVIASCVGGMPDVIQDGINGMLVPPRDSAVLAAAMLKLLVNKELRSKMGHSASEALRQRCRVERMIEQLTCVYEGSPDL
jgi:glycosyltransferase involved in cell wall biosynthesis